MTDTSVKESKLQPAEQWVLNTSPEERLKKQDWWEGDSSWDGASSRAVTCVCMAKGLSSNGNASAAPPILTRTSA